MLLQLIYFVIHLISVLHPASSYLPSSSFANSVRFEIFLHSLMKYWIRLLALIILQSLYHIKDSLPFKSLVRYLPESSVRQEKKATSQKNIKTFSKIIFFISLKIKPTVIWNSYSMSKDDLSSLSVRALRSKQPREPFLVH